MSFGVDWSNQASDAEKKHQEERLVEISNELQRIAEPDSGTYINEANPYEPYWVSAFWGEEKYKRLLQATKRVDPTKLMVCNRCVRTDILYDP